MFRLFRRLFGIFRRKKKVPQPQALPAETAPPTDTASPKTVGGASSPHNAANTPLSVTPVPPESMPSDSISPASAGPGSASKLTQPVSSGDTSLKNLKQVLNVLRAYVVTFGQPDSTIELRAVIGAIVANLATVTIENRKLEGFMDEAIAAFESLGTDASLVDVTAQLLAEQVAVWLQEQEASVSNIVSAYLQQFAPDDAVWNAGEIIGLVQTVIATLNDGSLSNSGGQVLVDKVIKSFDLDKALSRWVAPEWVGLAQRVASYVSHGDLQAELRSVAWAYIQKFQAILSPQLIEQIAVSGPMNIAPTELLSGDLGEFSQMLYYKFQLLEADPVVTKSHQAIAADMHQAISDLNDKRGDGLDVTKGIQGDLEVTSPIRRT